MLYSEIQVFSQARSYLFTSLSICFSPMEHKVNKTSLSVIFFKCNKADKALSPMGPGQWNVPSSQTRKTF